MSRVWSSFAFAWIAYMGKAGGRMESLKALPWPNIMATFLDPPYLRLYIVLILPHIVYLCSLICWIISAFVSYLQ